MREIIVDIPLSEEHSFYGVLKETDKGIVLYVVAEMPSSEITAENALAVIQVDGELSDMARVMVRLWDDSQKKEGDPTDLITLVEQDPPSDDL